jgi:small ligand-binding sensory domain FIST
MPDTAPMTCAAAISTLDGAREAVAETCQQLAERLGTSVDLVCAFLSPHHRDAAEDLAREICSRLGTECVIGCTAEAIIGNGLEVEAAPALSVWAAALPGVDITPLRLTYHRSPDGGSIDGFPDQLAGDWPDGAALLLVGDPFSFPADELLERFNDDRPGVPVVGGMASGAQRPQGNRLLLGKQVHCDGAVGVRLTGELRLRTVVSQGCRPIGQHFVVTNSDRNVIHGLGGKPAAGQLQEVFQSLPTSEQRLVQSGLFLGRVVSEYQDAFEQGDFLVRNVMGIDANSGGIVINDLVRVGQTVQFHVRDAKTADDELQHLLARVRDDAAAPPAGGLLFSCNGRGTRMFAGPDHDAGCVQAALPDLPLAGFFAAGELGPVGGRNFLHGFTASLALFEPA